MRRGTAWALGHTPSLAASTDTCSLFPQTLRDTLLRAAAADLCQIHWSGEILEELRRNLQEERGLTDEQVQHLLIQMHTAFPEAMVRGYEPLVPAMTNHPKDRHVLAAAVLAGAQVIVTDNLRDFTSEALSPYGIEARTPDEFLEYLYDQFPGAMAEIVIEQNAARQRPPEPLQRTLLRLGKSAPRFSERVSAHPRVVHVLERERLSSGSRSL
jgi:predicted nucleic acid-binding protein